MNKYYLACIAFIGVANLTQAQVGIGITKPSTSTMLHIVSSDGDRGVLLPKVKLTDINKYAPVKGNGTASENVGLVVYNENTANNITPGYYYWTGTLWTKILDSASTDSFIPSLPPVDPTDTDKKSYVIYNETTKEFYTVENGVNGKVVLELIPLKELVQKHETKTSISKRIDPKTGKGTYEFDIVEPTAKEGAIIYKYTSEELDANGKQKDFFINITQDIQASITENESIKNVINEIINNNLSQGGNVYYGDALNNGKDVLYILLTDKQTGKEIVQIIDISESILEIFTSSKQEIINEIRSGLGYNINTSVVSTGNKYKDKEIFSFAAQVKVEESDAETEGVFIPATHIKQFDKLFSIKFYDMQGNFINSGVTDVVFHKANGHLAFNLGVGGFYTSLPEGNYQVVVEFTTI